MGIKKPSPEKGASTKAPVESDGKSAAPASEDAAPPRVDLTYDLTGQVLPDTTQAASGKVETVRRREKRKYKARKKADTRKPTEAVKPPAGANPTAARVASVASGARNQTAGFAVTISVLHMGLALRVPEMALDRGEAEQLGAALDNLCREFGYKPSAKAAAVLAFAGTAFMVYAPKVAAVRANKGRAVAPKAAKVETPAPAPAVPDVDWEAVALAERTRVANGNGGKH